MPATHGDSTATRARPREAARVLTLDEDGRLLLLRGHDPAQPERSWWFVPGGGLDDGETYADAAARELREECGYVVPATSLEGPVWERTAVFDFMEVPFVQHEYFFVARVDRTTERAEVAWSDVELDMLDDVAWFAPQDLAAIDIEVFPEGLRDLVGTVAPWDGVLRDLGEGGLAWARRD